MADPYRCSPMLATEVLPARCAPLDASARTCPEVVRRRRASLRRTARAVAAASLMVAAASVSAFATRVVAARAHAWSPGMSFVGARALRPSAISLAAMGAPTHDASALWERAERFATKRGMTLVRASLVDDVPRAHAPTRVFPAQGGAPGLQLFGVAPDSSAALLGLQNGDVLTAVNGFTLLGPKDASDALRAASYEDVAVIELTRQGRPFAIRVARVRGRSTGRMGSGEPLGERQQHRQTQT